MLRRLEHLSSEGQTERVEVLQPEEENASGEP